MPPVKPMLAKSVPEVPVGDGFVYEPKWDGFRALVFRDGEEIVLQSRDEKPLNRYFPELLEPLQSQLPDRCVLDGDIVLLEAKTGWTLIGVQGLLPELDFFEHLANRRFPVTWWIRKPEQLDYLAEPDLFHDLFGHVPLLMNPVFADYMQAYGRGGVKAHGIGPEALAQLFESVTMTL